MGYYDEPDEKDWEHKGLRCFMRRGPCGSWCGYVMVRSDHPWYEVEYDEIWEDIEVHGGLTYSGRRLKDMDDGWCFGFDCAHCWDVSPERDISFIEPGAVYRDINYVTKETERLAEQLVRDINEQEQKENE